jgi:hypothetical protein
MIRFDSVIGKSVRSRQCVPVVGHSCSSTVGRSVARPIRCQVTLTRGGSCRCAFISATIPLAAANGALPGSNRKRLHPNECTSARRPSNR